MPDQAGAGEHAQTAPAKRRPRPITFYLLVLALVALVPAFTFSAILLQRNNEAQERVVETLVTGASRSLLQAVDREISGNITTLRVLATGPALAASDYQAFYNRVKLVFEGTGTYVYLLDSNLMAILNTRLEYGAAPRPSADPAAGRLAFDTRDVVVSSVIFGPVSQRWVFNVLLPVFPAGREPLVLGLSRDAGDLSAALLSDKLPDGWNVALVDADDVVIAASPGAAEPGKAFGLTDPRSLPATQGWFEVRADNTDYLAVAHRSLLTGWSIFAWAPRDLIAQPLATAFWSLLAGGILLAAVVVLIIYGVSFQIGRSVRGLEDDAKLLGVGETVPERDYPISEIATVSDSIADASRRRKAAETEVRLLMRELAHRSKNQLAVIAAMAKQSAKATTSVPGFVASFERRIHSLARSTDLLLAHGIAGVKLRDVLIRQIDPLCPLDSGRVTLAGPAFRLSTQSAQILGMAAHELATNAVKYGAFAVETGRLDVAWVVAGERLELVWRESGASINRRSRRSGFGTIVLENMVGRSLNAEVTRSLNDDGIEWRFVIPLEALDLHADPGTGGGIAAAAAVAAAPQK